MAFIGSTCTALPMMEFLESKLVRPWQDITGLERRKLNLKATFGSKSIIF
jgi:hypothetical protein